MNYRLDADIPWVYGITIDLETGKRIAPAVNVQWREPDDNFNGIRTYTIKIDFTFTQCNS